MDASSEDCPRTLGSPAAAAAVSREGDRDPLDFKAWLREVGGGTCSLDGYVQVLEREYDTVPQVLSIYCHGSAFAEDKFFEDVEVYPAHHALFRAWFEGLDGAKAPGRDPAPLHPWDGASCSGAQAGWPALDPEAPCHEAFGVCRAHWSLSDAYVETDGGVAEPHPDELRALGLGVTLPDPAGLDDESWGAPELTGWLREFGDDVFAAREHLLVHFSCVDDILELYSEGSDFLREDFFEDFEVFEEDHQHAFDVWFQGALASRGKSSASRSAASPESKEALEESRTTSQEDAQEDAEPREVLEESTALSAEDVQVDAQPDASSAGGTDMKSWAIPDDSLHPATTDPEQMPFNKLIAPSTGGCKRAKPAIAGA